MDDILEENKNFTSSDRVNRPLQTAVVGLEIIAALITNLFVLIFTLCHPKILKKSSIIFLTNYVLANLLMATVYMPTVIVTAATGKWIFGCSLEQKVAFCKFTGFIFACTVFLTTFTLTALSVDRFLFIVKPFVHKRYMKTKCAVLINVITWIASCLLTVPPFFGFGEYSFSKSNSTCVPAWYTDRIIYVAVAFLVVMACIVTIAITSIWTFCFTHKFIMNNAHLRYASTDDKKNVYNNRILRVMGIFGTMLLVTLITYAPGAVACMVGFFITFEKLPDEVFATITILFYTVTISNPMIQSYFRKELQEFIVSQCRSVINFTKRWICIQNISNDSKLTPLVITNHRLPVNV